MVPVSAEHVAGVLIPLLLRLRWNLSCRNLDLRIDGFSTFSAIVVKSFVDNHMPRRPPGFVPVERLQEIGCFEEQCKVCPDLRTFVLDKRATIQFKHREQIRNHIEKEAGVLKSLGFTRETIKGRTPYTLVITKPQNMVEFGLWYQAHVLGKRVLRLLGSTEALREILGQDYDGCSRKD
ncbi:hypothetical protein DFH09DRAFT_1353503 [Mycena vulgaris]|nr:hypothetical protein DFH09DRAFT_1353503 [Mycena vulgaris]